MAYNLRVRKPLAASFVVLLLFAAGLGLAPVKIPEYKQSDKVLHAVTFFLITLNFYWILETSRRRVVNLTLLICTVGMGIGSEVLQGLLPNGREFDPYDILANMVGSVPALLLSSWYHKRMLERKRAAKQYGLVPGEDLDEQDVELGEARADDDQEIGVVSAGGTTVTEQLDNWDENAEDWDDDEAGTADGTNGDTKTKAASTKDDGSTTKRDD